MNYMNDANWLGRVPRRLCETKWGADTRWEGYDNESRPTLTDCIAIAAFGVFLVIVIFLGAVAYGDGYGRDHMDVSAHRTQPAVRGASSPGGAEAYRAEPGIERKNGKS